MRMPIVTMGVVICLGFAKGFWYAYTASWWSEAAVPFLIAGSLVAVLLYYVIGRFWLEGGYTKRECAKNILTTVLLSASLYLATVFFMVEGMLNGAPQHLHFYLGLAVVCLNTGPLAAFAAVYAIWFLAKINRNIN